MQLQYFHISSRIFDKQTKQNHVSVCKTEMTICTPPARRAFIIIIIIVLLDVSEENIAFYFKDLY